MDTTIRPDIRPPPTFRFDTVATASGLIDGRGAAGYSSAIGLLNATARKMSLVGIGLNGICVANEKYYHFFSAEIEILNKFYSNLTFS